jgi:uncharacterized protein (DUF736 family)
MSDYDNEKRGVLFRQTDKKSEKSPDFNGNFELDGKKWQISAWRKVPKSGGSEYLSLSISEPRESSKDHDTKKEAIPEVQEPIDDIPF